MKDLAKFAADRYIKEKVILREIERIKSDAVSRWGKSEKARPVRDSVENEFLKLKSAHGERFRFTVALDYFLLHGIRI